MLLIKCIIPLNNIVSCLIFISNQVMEHVRNWLFYILFYVTYLDNKIMIIYQNVNTLVSCLISASIFNYKCHQMS